MVLEKERLVVVGSGMAGGKLIEELLQVEPERYAITVIGDEPHGNYNRIKLVVKLRSDDLPARGRAGGRQHLRQRAAGLPAAQLYL